MTRPPATSKPRRPIVELFDLIGQQRTLRILWELRGEPLTFRALQERGGGISPSLLSRRVRALTDADIIERTLEGYALSPLGKELGAKLLDLGAWSERWAKNRKVAGAQE